MTTQQDERANIQRLKQILRYEPESGLFYWLISPRNGINPGNVAGVLSSEGYLVVTVNNFGYLAHRLAWAFVHSCWPDHQIDHKNRNRTDNRICNLRPATETQNRENISLRKDNTSGYRGVYWSKETKKWAASIGVKKKRIHLGLFLDPKEAHAEYVKAASIYHTHNEKKAHGIG